jgi:hypothetical protein
MKYIEYITNLFFYYLIILSFVYCITILLMNMFRQIYFAYLKIYMPTETRRFLQCEARMIKQFIVATCCVYLIVCSQSTHEKIIRSIDQQRIMIEL